MSLIYTIVEADFKDSRAIAKIHVDMWRHQYKGLISSKTLDELDYESREKIWQKRLETAVEGSFHLVLKDGLGSIWGFASGGSIREPLGAFDAEVYSIYLDSKWHGKGLGNKLFLQLIERLKKACYSSVCLWVLEQNPSRGFYDTLGGTVFSLKKTPIGGEFYKEVLYGWPSIEVFK